MDFLKSLADLGVLSDKEPEAMGRLYLCAGDLQAVGVPCAMFGLRESDFAVVEGPGPKAERFGFARQALEPVVSVVVNAAVAWCLAYGLPAHRWAWEVA